MKKTVQKQRLLLTREVVRQLDVKELSQVAGGANDTNDCTQSYGPRTSKSN